MRPTRPSNGQDRRQHSGSSQRGFSLWEIAILVGILAVVLVTGFKLLYANKAEQVLTGRSDQIAAADRALAGFVADNGRLPCPDTTGTGVEDCSGTAQKGWLPVVTLGLVASGQARGTSRLKYIVYRGAGNLTSATNAYEPNLFDSSISYDQINTLDFCTKLAADANAAANAGNAHIPGASGATVNVAYALADGGIDKDGDGNTFDGINATATGSELESPARASDSNYDDIVEAKGFGDLQLAYQCSQATLGVNAVAAAVDAAVTVSDLKDSNYDSAVQQAINAGIATAMNLASGALIIAGMAAGAVVLSEAIACAAASLGLDFACDAAIGVAASGFIPAGIAVGLYVASITENIIALVDSAIAAQEAGASPNTCDAACQQQALQQALTNAQSQLATDQGKLATATSDYNNAVAKYNTDLNTVKGYAQDPNSGLSTTDYNNKFLPALNTALGDFATYQSSYSTYQSNYNQLTQAVKTLNQDITNLANAQQNITDAQNTYNADLVIYSGCPAWDGVSTPTSCQETLATDKAKVDAAQSQLVNLQHQIDILETTDPASANYSGSIADWTAKVNATQNTVISDYNAYIAAAQATWLLVPNQPYQDYIHIILDWGLQWTGPTVTPPSPLPALPNMLKEYDPTDYGWFGIPSIPSDIEAKQSAYLALQNAQAAVDSDNQTIQSIQNAMNSLANPSTSAPAITDPSAILQQSDLKGALQ